MQKNLLTPQDPRQHNAIAEIGSLHAPANRVFQPLTRPIGQMVGIKIHEPDGCSGYNIVAGSFIPTAFANNGLDTGNRYQWRLPDVFVSHLYQVYMWSASYS